MKISVIIPVYNAEKYVENAVRSAMQFEDVTEVILIEDKSPDNALEVCKKLAGSNARVKLFQHPDGENHGAGASRNLGIEKAAGDFIAFLDADDFYLPNRFDADRKLFQNREVDGVYNAVGISYYSAEAREQFSLLYGEKLDTVYKVWPPEDVFPGQLYLRGSFGNLHLNGLTIRRSALQKMPKFFNPELRLHQDTDFTIRLAFYLNLYTGNYATATALRGIHENNRISSVDSKKINPAHSREKLWKSLKNWSLTEDMAPSIRKHISRMHRSYEIAKARPLTKLPIVIHDLLTDPKSITSGIYNFNWRKNFK